MPKCGCLNAYKVASRHVWKCSGRAHQFYVTSGTIFADRKRPLRDYPLAIAIFTNGAKGHSALQLSRDLCCTYKSAFVLSHKLREAIETSQQAIEFAPETEKEIDGAYFGDEQKQTNEVANRVDRRLAEEQTGKRQVVVVVRERYGRTLPFVFGKEATPSRRSALKFLWARQFTLTKRAAGMCCTLTTTCTASTIPSLTAKITPAPIKPSRISLACAVLRLAFITVWPGRI